jgi:hypothetical protein
MRMDSADKSAVRKLKPYFLNSCKRPS